MALKRERDRAAARALRAEPAGPPVPAAPAGSALIRVLLIDPRPLTAKAVRRFLETAPAPGEPVRFDVTARAPDAAAEAGTAYDVVLLHVPPSADGAGEITRCLAALPDALRAVPAVVYSDCGTPEAIAAAVRGGARGYLPSSLDSAEIVEALRLLAAGLAVLPPEALARLAGGAPAGAGPRDPGTPAFTRREVAVLRGLRDGKPNKLIAHDLDMSPSTVKAHVRSIFRKLGARNRTEAALAAEMVLAARPDPV